jgi:thiamine transport system permease protein
MAIIGLLTGGPFVALLSHLNWQALTEPFTNSWLRRVIAFSFYQAFLSTLISVLVAIPVARALSRRQHFAGRRLLLNLFSVALIIPTIVAVFGIVACYGKTGWLNQLLEWWGFEPFSIYGLTGILLAHVFFNMPMATRILLQSLDAIPESNWKLAAQLGTNSWQLFRLLEWPAIRQNLAGIVLLIFSLCFTSFAIVMTLGGGPRATTIEVAIYQALRFDFDLGTAVSLALVQMICCIVLMIFAGRLQGLSLIRGGRRVQAMRFYRDSFTARLMDYAVIALAFSFVILPLLALFLSALNPSFSNVLLSASTGSAAFNTIWVACLSGTLCILLSCLLLMTSRHWALRLQRPQWGSLLEYSGMAILVVPPVVLGTGLFLMLRPYADVFSVAFVLVILINALMGLPFALRILSVPMMQCASQNDRLCVSLGVTGWNRLRFIEWPVLRKPLGLAAAVTTTLSAGDLTVIALFGSERVATLPLLLYQRMGSYRLFEAATTALLLLLVCLALFWLIERIVGGADAARVRG